MTEQPAFRTQSDVFARLDELRQQRDDLKARERATLSEIKDVVRTAGGLQFDGEPINRTLLIEHAGLSRRTAYQVLPPEPTA